MKLVLYDDYKPGLLKDGSVVDLSGVVQPVRAKRPEYERRAAQETMEEIIYNWDSLRPKIEEVQARAPAPHALSEVKLRSPLPKPGKIVAMGVNYLEFTPGPPQPIMVFLKSPEAVPDPGDTITLPPHEFTICHHEAELTVVIGKKARNVPQAQWQDYVFGYTCGVDVSARGQWGGNVFIGKSFDGFNPLGPCIATKDEIPDPHTIQVRFFVDGQPRHDYNTSDMAHKIPECVEYCSSIMTLLPGDVIMLGTNHQGIGPLQDGETAEMEVKEIGPRLTFKVSDPQKRSWPKAVDKQMADMVRSRFTAGR